jgi:hypothetical protein
VTAASVRDNRTMQPAGLLRLLFIVHGVVTLAAAMVLAALPAVIPATVDIPISPQGFLLSYFLAAAELAIAVLSRSERYGSQTDQP